MTGPEHFAEAQTFAEASVYAYQNWGENGDPRELESARWQQAQGQLHATLAAVYAQNRSTTELISLLQGILHREPDEPDEPEWDCQDSNAYVAAEEARAAAKDAP